MENVARCFQDVVTRDEDQRLRAAKSLRVYVENQRREKSPGEFLEFMNDMNGRIMTLVNSPDVSEKIGAITVIDELMNVELPKNADTIIIRFANYLRMVLQSSANHDEQTLELAARTLGHIARSGSPLSTEVVQFEMRQALEWLDQERQEHRICAAVLVLKEMAKNAPTIFSVELSRFIEYIWCALWDAKPNIRVKAVEAVRAVLHLVASRTPQERNRHYVKIYQECVIGFDKNTPETIHGSLLVIGELLRRSGQFMQPRLKNTCERVLKLKTHPKKLIRQTVIQLLPQLAQYDRDKFCEVGKNNETHLQESVMFMITCLRQGQFKDHCYTSLGEIALAVGELISKYLRDIVELVKDGLSQRNKKQNTESALECLSMLACAVGPILQPLIDDLPDLMFNSGLSPTLIKTLNKISYHIPSLREPIQTRLMTTVSAILEDGVQARRWQRGVGHRLSSPGRGSRLSRGSYHSSTRSSTQRGFKLGIPSTPTAQEAPVSPELIKLAMETLGTFNLHDHNLLPFARETVATYLEDDNTGVRLEAALTSSKLLLRVVDHMHKVRHRKVEYRHKSTIVKEVLERLLTVAIADSEVQIRGAVLRSLDPKFDHYLGQAEALSKILIALNDEVFEIRQVAMSVIGRLALRNPAHVMPALRKTLIQLLTELQVSEDPTQTQKSSELLGGLIVSAEELVRPYVSSILRVLLPQLKGPGGDSVMATIGKLADVAGDLMEDYVDKLLPVIVDNLESPEESKRQIALKTLAQIGENTGCVVTPYHKYKELLPKILSNLSIDHDWSVREEAIRVIGVIGALDPHTHRSQQLELQETNGRKKEKNDISPPEISTSDIDSTEEYYPYVAINALMKILRDPGSSSYHNEVHAAVMYIFKSMGIKCIPFLPQIIPSFLQSMRTCEPGHRESLFDQLVKLVNIVKNHIRKYLPGIFEVINRFWSEERLRPSMLDLMKSIAEALRDEFKVYIPDLLPLLLGVLQNDKSPDFKVTQHVLDALVAFGPSLEAWLFLILPPLMKLCEKLDIPEQVRSKAIQTIRNLCNSGLSLRGYISRIIHPIVRVIDTSSSQKLQFEAIEALCSLLVQLGSDYAIFIPMVDKVLSSHKISHPSYNKLVNRLLKEDTMDMNSIVMVSEKEPDMDMTLGGMSSEKTYQNTKIRVSHQSLKKAWDAQCRATPDDWSVWIRGFSVEMLKQSPIPALRSCSGLAQKYFPLAKELFNAAFLSCWVELYDQHQDDLIRSLETAFLKALDDKTGAPSIPTEVLQQLLNLAEFMEQKGHALPINIKILSRVAEICHSYAKALHYKEQEFRIKPWGAIEQLMSINNRLQQSQAADGILEYALEKHDVPISAKWYEELNRWDDALDAYERCQLEEPDRLEYTLGRMRCLRAVGNWERLDHLSNRTWDKSREPDHRRRIATFGAFAAWNLGDWKSMSKFVQVMDSNKTEGTFLNAVMAVHNDEYENAIDFIEKTRKKLDEDLTTIIGESYDRAYQFCVFAQQLVELEEVLKYKKTREEGVRSRIRVMWAERLKGCKKNVDVWQQILQVRSLVLEPQDDEKTWLTFSSLCRQSGQLSLSLKVLKSMMTSDDMDVDSIASPHVGYEFTKHLWATGSTGTAKDQLSKLINLLESEQIAQRTVDTRLLSKCYLRLGSWEQEQMSEISAKEVSPILKHYKMATQSDPDSCRAWHTWALMNYEVINTFSRDKEKKSEIDEYLVPAIQGFFKSIELDEKSSQTTKLQDILRLLNLWFNHGFLNTVKEALEEGFSTISVDTWLSVIPQIIARIHTSSKEIRELIHELFHKIGAAHPQALVYPLTVARKSHRLERQQAAKKILDSMRMHSAKIVDEADMVSKELIRVAILWHEMWHEALEEASRIYFTNNDVEGMFAQLEPLHEMMRKGPQTLREVAFRQAFGRDLGEAEEWCSRYKKTKAGSDLNQAWEYYCQVFRRINKQLPQLVDLDLTYVSEKLKEAHDLDLAMPGTYQSGKQLVRIAKFHPTLTVLESKQRPRRLTIIGSDGKDYDFLLKGHEDLRQDERVMQLFELVNNLLAHDEKTFNLGLRIKRYNIIPLAPNSGLIEWMGHTDTVHALIKQYRDHHRILLNCEHRLLMSMAPKDKYHELTLIQKVEVFEHALACTSGMDLAIVSWLNAANSEVWLRKRTNYTRSLAVMSMVGYILGLGDRHPMNLLIHRFTGKLIHIDFGDCFEVAMQRDKFPERVPFRLTRMLVRAMEVSGIEGNYRSTCEQVMSVLRENKESLMAVLEAFVHDPLINWRLLKRNEDETEESASKEVVSVPTDAPHRSLSMKSNAMMENSVPARSRASRHSRVFSLQINNPSQDKLNSKALDVLTRVSNKLRGRDFEEEGDNLLDKLNVKEQVDRLIAQATNHENLCQAWIGWCPFW